MNGPDMAGPVRLGLDGNPLNDTWSNYSRKHWWASRGVSRTLTSASGEDVSLVKVYCERCGQTREVSTEATGYMWGCPRVPLWYQLRYWWRVEPLPEWSVNTKPPWKK